MNHLTELQQRFVLYYAEHGNATQAYLSANPGVKYTSAKTQGYFLLQNPDVLEAIEQKKEENQLAYDVTKEKMVRELSFSAEQAKNMGDFKAYATLKNMVIKLFGLYEPDKVLHSGDQNITVIKTTEVKKEEPNPDGA